MTPEQRLHKLSCAEAERDDLRAKLNSIDAAMEMLIETMGSDGDKHDAAIIPRACRVIGELRARNIVLVGHANVIEAEHARQIERMLSRINDLNDQVRSLEVQVAALEELTRLFVPDLPESVRMIAEKRLAAITAKGQRNETDIQR